MRYLATVAKGLEAVVWGELSALGLEPGPPRPGLVPFEGGWEAGYRACLRLRAARRVLLELGRFEASHADGLYAGARALRWPDHFGRKTTFAVEASVRDHPSLTHSGYAALKVKDAVADALRAVFGVRPDVDREDPDVRVVLHLHGTSATIALDLAGPLHKRGYRVKTVPAPLNETLAAGILLLAGYDGTAAFADPFCGSGTLCIEAALIASGTAPGLVRKVRFGFQRWPGFRDRTFQRLVEEARAAARRPSSPILGSDADGRALIAARDNAAAAGMSEWIRFERRDAREFVSPGPGCLVVSNPPYGDHAGAGEDLPALYRAFGDALKRNAGGATAYLLCGNPALAKCVGLRAARRIPLWNGPMECRLLEYRMVEGAFRTPGKGESAAGTGESLGETPGPGRRGVEGAVSGDGGEAPGPCPRVDLRPPQPGDLPILFEHQRDPEAAHMAAFPPRDWEAFQAHWAKILADPEVQVRTVLADGKVAGDLLCWGPAEEKEVGYWIGREFWGRGVATRALAAFLGVLEFPVLFAHVAKHNVASRRVLEKCGFKVCGEMRRACGEPPLEADEFVLRWERAEETP